MKGFITVAFCALSWSVISFAAGADAAKPAEEPKKEEAAKPAEEAKPADGAHKWAHLSAAHDDLVKAKEDLTKAEENHKDKGTLGGHGAKAVEHVDAATKHVAEAAAFADAHPDKKGHHPGTVTAKEKHHAAKDDAKYPNLGGARAVLETAEFQLEEARQYHKPVGGLGGHAEKAIHEIKAASKEINKADQFADKHDTKKQQR